MTALERIHELARDYVNFLHPVCNQRLKAVGLFRTVFFLPSVVPVVATAIMWKPRSMS